MMTISLIGSGNLAQHLIVAFQNAEKSGSAIRLIQVFARQKEKLTHLLHQDKITTDYTELKEADLYIIAVSDDAIKSISSQLSFQNRLVVHTSGAVAMDTLDNKNRKGVFYPLQTFTKNKAVDFKTIPICLETENTNDYAVIEKVAQTISDAVYKIDSEQRKALHVAAVFVNNFSNHLYQIGNEICNNNQIPFSILQPLIQETAQKIIDLSPQEAQTGPAIRNDQNTIAAHQALLTHENHKNIYTILTQSIQNNGKKL
ncbi:DUF2520 domain-containing protein [Flavobacterium sp. NG2]|uniref:Rossmann-like and DUF2520 domain-containing protein n=1 Tax=Flavobacterium sp. NG2 TaxID=3097547 RepID=UPI002A811334|nr:DUF2520 domain-containing protein [Flavobacterium sp. NG2]WPR70472.1 DUF2520 domain-containing protein [Flavobacterium sp. NG2]